MPHISNAFFQRIFYRKHGNGPAIVLLHGFPEDGNLWRLITPVLSDHFTVIIPDLPGSGESDLPADNVSVEQLAESVNLVLEHENISEALIAGHSMGGYVALAFAEKYPEKVKGLSMVHSTSEADDDAKKETRRKAIALIQKGGRAAFIKQMIPDLFSETFRVGHPGVIADQIQRGQQLPEKSLIAYYNAMINRPQRTKVIEEAGWPVQWIIGKNDKIVPFQKALHQSYLSSINFVCIYDNSAHMSMLENPIKLTQDIKEFIAYCYNVRK